ncbi:MAG TPA: hypothetical protein VGJ88_05655, partial [Thermoanaerobaculia bacterium]
MPAASSGNLAAASREPVHLERPTGPPKRKQRRIERRHGRTLRHAGRFERQPRRHLAAARPPRA